MVPTTPDMVAINLLPGQVYTAADFGFIAGALINGTVFYDENGSGSLDGSESVGFGGVVVTLTTFTGAVLTTSSSIPRLSNPAALVTRAGEAATSLPGTKD